MHKFLNKGITYEFQAFDFTGAENLASSTAYVSQDDQMKCPSPNPEDLLSSQERNMLKYAEMVENGEEPPENPMTDSGVNESLLDEPPAMIDDFNEDPKDENEEPTTPAATEEKSTKRRGRKPKQAGESLKQVKEKSTKKTKAKSKAATLKEERHVTFSPDIVLTEDNNILPKTPMFRRSKRISERLSNEKNTPKSQVIIYFFLLSSN